MTIKTHTLTLLMLSGTALADAAQFGEFTYHQNEMGIIITKYSGQESEVTIPTTIEGFPVIEIGEGAFSDCRSLTKLSIPVFVLRIGVTAFWGCVNLTAIQVHELNPSFLGLDGVLFDHDGRTLILCPEGKSGNYAIPDGVTHVERNAFSWCSRLTGITIPDSVTSLGEESFSSCSGLAEITIPNGVVALGRSAFQGCHGLTNVSLSTGLTRIESRVFSYCTSLANLSIPDSINHIEYQAFAGCLSLPSVTIPQGVSGIGDYAFQGCSGLTNASLGNGLSQLGVGVFEDCSNLTAIDVDALNAVYSSLEGVLFDGSRSTLLRCPGGKAGAYVIPAGVETIEDRAFFRSARLTGVSIPGSVTRIGKLAFADCHGLTDVLIPGSVHILEEYAFADCRDLTQVSIEKGVSHIREGTFGGCLSLSEINLPDTVTTIGAWAFNGCSSLPRLVLPRSLVSIGELAFGGCARLTALEVDVRNPTFSTLDGVLFDRNRTTLILCPQGMTGDYAIPDGVSRVGEGAFAFCTRLTSIAIPDSVTELGDYAMTGCHSLTRVMIPPNVTAIGVRPFSGSTNLSIIAVDPANIAFRSHEGVLIDRVAGALIVCPQGKIGSYSIPEGIVSIGDYAFAGCTRLTIVTVPQSLAKLGQWAFVHCTHLVGTYFTGNVPAAVDWSSVFVGAPGVIVYHRPSANGWTPVPPELDRPMARWLDPIQYGDWLPTSGLLNSYPASTAEADDPDGDGMSNVAEMLAGTDPTDRASALVLELAPRPQDLAEEDRLPLQPGQYAIYFRSVPGKHYGIQWIETLDGPRMVLGMYGWMLYDPAWHTEAVVTAKTSQTRFVFDHPRTFCRVVLAQ